MALYRITSGKLVETQVSKMGKNTDSDEPRNRANRKYELKWILVRVQFDSYE